MLLITSPLTTSITSLPSVPTSFPIHALVGEGLEKRHLAETGRNVPYHVANWVTPAEERRRP